MNTLLTTLTAVFAGIGRAQFFLINVLAALPAALTRPRLLAQQVHSVGVMSLIIVVLSGSFVHLQVICAPRIGVKQLRPLAGRGCN